MLLGIAGVSVYHDDIIASGKDVEEHDDRLKNVLNVIDQSGMKLNSSQNAPSGSQGYNSWGTVLMNEVSALIQTRSTQSRTFRSRRMFLNCVASWE